MSNKRKYVEITGIKEADELFRELSYGEFRSVFVAAYRRAARPLITKARRNIKQRLGSPDKIRSSIGTKPLNKQEIGLKVGARARRPHMGQLAHIYDKGTKERGYTKNGVYHRTGRIKATHFFTDAIEESEQEMKSRIRQDMRIALSNHVKRKVKKYGV